MRQREIELKELLDAVLRSDRATQRLQDLLDAVSQSSADQEILRKHISELFHKNLEDGQSPDSHHHDLSEVERIGKLVGERLRQRQLELAPKLSKSNRKSVRRLWGWKAAAVILLSLSSICLMYLIFNSESSSRGRAEMGEVARGTPAFKMPTLVAGNGEQLVLDGEKQGIQVGESLTYIDGTKLDGRSLSKDELMTLVIPEGMTYSIRLSDGSTIWLNAGSQLKYPATFDVRDRVVELIGEAYFDIEKGPRQQTFRVKTPHQEILVLGTEFNVYAFPNEPISHTTLIEGKVEVQLRSSGASKATTSSTLEPGQQALVQFSAENGPGMQTISKVEIRSVTAWKDGRFTFDGKPFEQIMQELSRWYGFDVQYVGGIPKLALTGGAFRNADINTVYRLLESSGVRYEVSDASTRRSLILYSNSGH